jgi:hypothetical protein
MAEQIELEVVDHAIVDGRITVQIQPRMCQLATAKIVPLDVDDSIRLRAQLVNTVMYGDSGTVFAEQQASLRSFYD